MPKVIKSKKNVRPTSFTALQNSPVGESDYKHFLNTYIAGSASRKKDQKYLSRSKINNWQDADLTPMGQIINEIAKKFNTSNTLGINDVPKYDNIGGDIYYRPDVTGKFTKVQMGLAPPITAPNKDSGPRPITMAHELVHANDHQVDYLNPKIWGRLKELAMKGGANHGSMNNFAELEQSIGNIQDKIDLTGAFRPNPAYPGSGYKIDQNILEREMTGAHNTYKHPASEAVTKAHELYKSTGSVGAAPPSYLYTTPTLPPPPPAAVGAANIPNWEKLFDDINDVVSHKPDPKYVVNNPGFFFPQGSEFPAFIAENLTRNWDTQDVAKGRVNPLQEKEAKTLYNMLGDMGNAYPAQHPPANAAAAAPDAYPVMNQHIMARRKSIFDAFHNTPAAQATTAAANAAGAPAAPAIPNLPDQWLSHGGRVTGKNLLARFKKPKRKGS